MQTYASIEDYKTNVNNIIEIEGDAEIEKYLKLGSREIDIVTLNIFRSVDYNTLEEDIKNVVIVATCYMANSIYRGANNKGNNNISEYSIGKVSIKYKDEDNVADKELNITYKNYAIDLLDSVGLIDRRTW